VTAAGAGSCHGLVVVGLGANVGAAAETLRGAIYDLRLAFGPLRVASCYRTAPISAIPQDDFLNTVAIAALDGRGSPRDALRRLKSLERQAGRRPGPIDGPRPLDLDLLIYGDAVGQWPDHGDGLGTLILPHPRLRQRRFVLAPLAELAPELTLPPDGARVADLLAALGAEQRVERLDLDLDPDLDPDGAGRDFPPAGGAV
jgi:2-amino-4-hydroxy-6-hydroxymethyldihydropteridine diphosphokinase